MVIIARLSLQTKNDLRNTVSFIIQCNEDEKKMLRIKCSWICIYFQIFRIQDNQIKTSIAVFVCGILKRKEQQIIGNINVKTIKQLENLTWTESKEIKSWPTMAEQEKNTKEKRRQSAHSQFCFCYLHINIESLRQSPNFTKRWCSVMDCGDEQQYSSRSQRHWQLDSSMVRTGRQKRSQRILERTPSRLKRIGKQTLE